MFHGSTCFASVCAFFLAKLYVSLYQMISLYHLVQVHRSVKSHQHTTRSVLVCYCLWSHDKWRSTIYVNSTNTCVSLWKNPSSQTLSHAWFSKTSLHLCPLQKFSKQSLGCLWEGEQMHSVYNGKN